MDPATLTALDKSKLLALLPSLDPKAVDYYNGKQLGSDKAKTDYWAGPMVPPSHPKYGEMQAALVNGGFKFRNATAEVCQRTADSVTADEVDWGLTPNRALEDGEKPTEQEQALIDEAEAALTTWWDRNKIAEHLQDRGPRLVGFGRTGGRRVVPPRYINEGQLQTVSTGDEALLRLRIKPADELCSGIVEDPETLDLIAFSVYQVTDDAGQSRSELELSYLDEQGRTVLRVLQDDLTTVQESVMDLGGHLWLAQATIARPLITNDLMSQQDALNVALTLLDKNTHFAGFVERYGVGIEQPTDEDGKPIALQVGPGTANFFQASTFAEMSTDAMGNTSRSERPGAASYGRFEPSDPKALTAAVDYAEMNLYAIARQRFIVMSDTATASGRSREVAAGDYLVAAGRVARAIEGYTRDILEFALAFMGQLMGQPGKYAGLRASVTCRVRGFNPDATDRAQDLAELQAGAMSTDTFLARRGDADVDAEKARIETEKAANQAEALKLAQAMPKPTPPPQDKPAEQVVTA